MLIRPVELEKIRRGEVDLAFRRWDRPRLLVGTKQRTKVGLVEMTSVDPVVIDEISEADARRAGASSRTELLELLAGRPDRPVYRIGLRYAGADPRIALRSKGDLEPDEIATLRSRLDRLDAASRVGAWTRPVLMLIAARPAVRAPDLAAALDRDTVGFKRDVRKLKELGLTESLDVGYRVSPRGQALLASMTDESEEQ